MPEAIAKRPIGRPRTLTPERIATVLDAIAEGASVRQACLKHGIARLTLRRELQREPALWTRYMQAREGQAESYIDDLLEVAEPVPGEDNAAVQARRLKIDTLKWIAAKLHPKVYGDYAGKGPDTINVSVETLHLTALKQLQAPAIQDAEIIPE